MATKQPKEDWWTSPAESESGELIMVTGRRNMECVMNEGKFKYRAEIIWSYEGDKMGMPDIKTSTLMEEVQDALQKEFIKDPVAYLTGIYTGANERDWVFYTLSTNIFQKKINEALMQFDILPLKFKVVEDPLWDEYREMKETEILGND